MIEASNLCRYLEWDTAFFGSRIASISVNSLNRETLVSVLAWCEANEIDCLYFLVDASDGSTIKLAEENEFRLVDIRMTYERQLGSGEHFENKVPGIRPAGPDDIQALRAIARDSHHDSRFYYDQNFSKESCDSLYETWIEKCCNGYADKVLVAELDGQAVGYISCCLPNQTTGEIGLFGVSAGVRGRGYGRSLINGSLSWFAAQSVTRVTVVTQGRNLAAQRLYQRCGFLTKSVQLWYHRWFSKGYQSR